MNIELSYKQWEQLQREVEKMQITARKAQQGGQEDTIPFLVLMRICRDYADKSYQPLIDEEARDKQLIEKLKRFRIKYFETV